MFIDVNYCLELEVHGVCQLLRCPSYGWGIIEFRRRRDPHERVRKKGGWLACIVKSALRNKRNEEPRARSIGIDSFAMMLHFVKSKPFAIARDTASMVKCSDRRLHIPIDTVRSLFTCGA